jgi:hypothetical protein
MGCHAPPPGLAFGEPDDRLLGVIRYAATSRFHHGRFGILDRLLSRATTAENAARSYSTDTTSRSLRGFRASFAGNASALSRNAPLSGTGPMRCSPVSTAPSTTISENQKLIAIAHRGMMGRVFDFQCHLSRSPTGGPCGPVWALAFTSSGVTRQSPFLSNRRMNSLGLLTNSLRVILPS